MLTFPSPPILDPIQYCLGAGKDSPEGDCLKGYYCNSGSPVPNPNIAPGGSYGLCPAGSYCPGGNTITGCPVGTFNPRIGGEDVNACFPCQPGMYCNDTGLEHPVGPCDEGFYCLQGAQSPTPPNGATGGPCPQGHYCPVGTVSPIPCDDGFFADVTGLVRFPSLDHEPSSLLLFFFCCIFSYVDLVYVEMRCKMSK